MNKIIRIEFLTGAIADICPFKETIFSTNSYPPLHPHLIVQAQVRRWWRTERRVYGISPTPNGGRRVYLLGTPDRTCKRNEAAAVLDSVKEYLDIREDNLAKYFTGEIEGVLYAYGGSKKIDGIANPRRFRIGSLEVYVPREKSKNFETLARELEVLI